jgi:amino acid adenylation domain-containing protein
MLVGLLGILKAGGAYLPLDPTYPQERLAFQMADAQVRWLVCQKHLLTHLPTFDGQLICLDTDWDEVAQGSGTSLTNESDGATLAYVIYTSGSTGQPKGVQIPHRAVGNFLASMQQQLGITAQERLLAVTTLSFDIAALELFLPLSVGASLVLLSRAEVSDGSLLAQTLSLMGATVMQATPTTWHLLLASGWSGSSRLKGLCGGEALPTELARQMRSKMAALWNMYGPTETTIWSTIFPVDPTGEQTSNPVALGRPIANTQVYVLDSFLHPVVPGVIGELYIGGLGVARGYMNRPHLTAERFVPHPYSSEPGARLYRTGDQVRYRTDGVLEYLGRIDQQVKVRGHRIELGEIEAILTTHPAVRQSVVMVREDTPGDQRLVAYVVANSPEDINHHELHIHMQRKLPNYMLPSAYVRLESLPLTPNGKLDRRMLSSLIPTSSPQQEESVPLTTVEELLANIWRQVLGIEQISRHDNFFELGGHSLLVTQVAVRIRSLFQVDLPLQALFTFPTLSELARYVLETQRQKQDLLLPPLERGLQTEHIPLSFAQQRLWFLAQLEPDSTHYTIPGALRLSGHLVLAALEQSLQAVIKRHDVLRTTFHLVESQPIQVICPVETLPPFSLPLIDLSPLSVQQQELQVQSLARQEADAAFDLTQGPLWRSHVLRLSSQEHVMLLSFHHIIFDGWSKDVLIRELRAHYTAYLADKEPQISPLPLQYADYAIWQRQWLQGEILEQRLVYWKKQLANLPTVSLPTDYPRPAVQSHKGRQHIFVLPGELLISLRQLSRREEVTLFMTLLVAFQVLVARYSRQYDIVVGTPIAHRTHMETEGLIGFFVNTLVLRTDLSDEPTVRDCLRRIRQVCLEAYAHQDVPFEQVVEALQPRRDLSHAPLFQLLFALENTPDEPLELPDLQLHIQEGELSTARFDLELNMRETRDGLQGVLTYSTDLFTSETIQRFARHYRQLLEGLLANTSQPVSTLPLLSDEEQQQVLETWNTLPPDDQQEQCLHQRYLEQVLRTPDAIVVVSEEEQISYQVLDQRANQLANALRKRGVGSEVKVGLYVERSVDMLIGMLGVLKAGGGYVPLDPSYPDERLAFLLDDAQPRLLLTQQQFLGRALAWKGERMCLDTDWDQLAQEPDICPENTATVENLAYVIYTSGSSGQPKGVQISHRNVERLLRVCQAHFHFDEHDTWTCFHSFAFDFSVWELWGPLVHGSRLVLVPYWVSRSPVAFVDLLQQHQVSVLNQTPSAFRQLLWAERKRSRRQGERLALRLIIFGGEALEHTEVQNWFELYGDQQPQLFNMYGITETTVHVTVHRLLQADGTALVGSRIGRPLADLQAYILDPRQQLMPPGVPGELYIGGAGLACGYLNRPELTAERFVPHPWGNEPGARLYRTGDLARYRSDGILEYLGRLDRQVKVRGYRIELGEIEAALNMHPAVQQSVVVMREDVPGDQRLVAYLVTASQELASSHDLRTHLHNHLPDYMLPASYVYLAHLPLTTNGKLDRQALPLPGATGSSSQEEFVAPRTALEEVLGGIWQQALGLERVSIHDNFFELGGHSLLATQVVNQINALFQVDLPLRTFFTVRTLANLADLLITYEVVPGQIETIAQSYQEIEHMSASEIRAMLESN